MPRPAILSAHDDTRVHRRRRRARLRARRPLGARTSRRTSRDRGIRLRWNEATGYDECLVEDRMATDRGLVGLGNAGESFDDFGQRPPLRGPEPRRASTRTSA